MSAYFQYNRSEKLEMPSISNAPSTENTKSVETGQKPTDLSWASGLLDGEGCFMFHSTAIIAVDSTSKTTVERLYKILGGSCSALNRRTDSNRPVFRWRITGPSAVLACRLIKEYLVEKKKQAELLIIFNRFPVNSAMRESLRQRLSDLKRTV